VGAANTLLAFAVCAALVAAGVPYALAGAAGFVAGAVTATS
jgi:hypothetical protein